MKKIVLLVCASAAAIGMTACETVEETPVTTTQTTTTETTAVRTAPMGGTTTTVVTE